jgi:hypothetical protein
MFAYIKISFIKERQLLSMISAQLRSAIHDLKSKTNAVKSAKLAELETLLSDFLSKRDPALDDFFNLKNKCRELLSNTEFTYKRVSFFGLFKSRSENVALTLEKELEKIPLFEIAIQKLKENFPEEKFLPSLKRALSDSNYKLAADIINDNEEILKNKTPNILADLKKQLREILAFSTSFKGTSLFSPTHDPLLEKDKSQRVYSLYELHEYMKQAKINQSFSFIYAIDLNGNIFFSKDAQASFHINLCGGKKTRGAGEIYLHKNNKGMIKVTLINNKSGLYLPTDEFLNPLCQTLAACDFDITSSRLEDERTKLISNYVQNRILFR